jgi:chorismate mutase
MTEISSGDSSLEAARGHITELTLQLVRLLSARAEAALVIGGAKASDGASQVRDLEREKQVIDLAIGVNQGPMSSMAIARILQVVMNEASALQAETFGLPLGVPLEEGPGFAIGTVAGE